MLIALLASVAMQTQQPAANQGLRIEVQPANPVVVAQDTLRLRARVLDARGQPVPNAQIRFIAAGGRFEGEVEENGLLHSGSTGTLPVTIVAQVPGQPAINHRIEVRMVPGPAASIAITQNAARMLVGQRRRLDAIVKSAAGDRRDDNVLWSSSDNAVASISEEGLVTAKAPGRVTFTGRVGATTSAVTSTVVANTVASLALTPSTTRA